MSRTFRISVFILIAVLLEMGGSARAQSSLSQNSGINSADTWITATVNLVGNGSITLAAPAYDPATQTTTSNVPINSNQSFTFEAGYDANGGLVVNIFPTSTGNPQTSNVSLVSAIRYAGGQMTVFDQSGNPIPVVMPNSNMPIPSPLAFLGANPGSSVIAGIVVPQSSSTFPAQARMTNAAVSFPDGAHANVVGSTGSGATAAWAYALTGSNWIAQSVTLSASMTNGTSTRSFNFSNVAWNDNATNDAARASAAATVAQPPSASTSVPSSLAVPAPNAQYTSNAATITPSNCNSNIYNLGGPQNVVMQHGLNSTSCAWTRMANWLNQDFRFGTEVIPSLPPNDPLATQGQDLVNQIQAASGSSYILMGHSQGGLVSRSAAQYFQTNTPLASSGVITIDSPNNGADFATNGFVALGFLTGWGATSFVTQGCVTGFETQGCWISLAEVVAGAGLLTDITAIQQSIPDMVPGSNYLTSLNSYPETFNRAAVIGYTPQRWAFTRVLSEKLDGVAWGNQLGPEPCNPEDSCGERAIASDTEYFYDAVEIALAVDIVVGFFDPAAWAIAPYLIDILLSLDVADAAYDLFMDFPGDGSSDGIVDGPGQIYLGANAGAVQYPISNADSHSAALRSTYDHTVLDTILANQFHVPTQASCAFATSTPSLSTSGQATSGNISLSSASGCQWSATSQVPWLTVTSGINGISSGTIEYSVQANPTYVPRQGAIQIGNGISSTLFSVSQGGVCVYSMWDTYPVLTVPPAGTTVNVPVSTSLDQDCAWSAVSNANWLTITSGFGTGNGSFSFTAAPNTGNTVRTGTISLMGSETLTVTDGISAGTPGTAIITISGFPRTAIMRPCNAPSQPACPVYETGQVYVTIDGANYEVGYAGSGMTASSLASQLASAMNRPMSPVSAIVSGATITVTSTINGTGSNFPVVTSSYFNPNCSNGEACFTSPSWIATASGPYLTGGTN